MSLQEIWKRNSCLNGMKHKLKYSYQCRLALTQEAQQPWQLKKAVVK